jgi:hypothetical protein
MAGGSSCFATRNGRVKAHYKSARTASALSAALDSAIAPAELAWVLRTRKVFCRNISASLTSEPTLSPRGLWVRGTVRY